MDDATKRELRAAARLDPLITPAELEPFLASGRENVQALLRKQIPCRAGFNDAQFAQDGLQLWTGTDVCPVVASMDESACSRLQPLVCSERQPFFV